MILKYKPPTDEAMYKEEGRNFLSPIWAIWFQKVTERICGYFTDPVQAPSYSLTALNAAPSSASDTGTVGEIRITSTYIYVCVATDTWKRAAIATWP